ncbi:MAG: hypothetical protein IJG30_05690 [Synergistaceae bacterium]|nr:hypothetical protein [Synergistaceae bacterium]
MRSHRRELRLTRDPSFPLTARSLAAPLHFRRNITVNKNKKKAVGNGRKGRNNGNSSHNGGKTTLKEKFLTTKI